MAATVSRATYPTSVSSWILIHVPDICDLLDPEHVPDICDLLDPEHVPDICDLLDPEPRTRHL